MSKEKDFEEFISKEKKALISGPFGSNISAKFFVDEGVPVIRGNNLSTGFKKFIDEGFAFVTEQKAEELNTYAICDDIIFTAVGTIGQVGIIPKSSLYPKYIISNKQLRVRLDTSKLDPLFAFYWFTAPWMVETIKSRNVGSTVPLINLGIVRKLPVRAPEKIEDQRAITKILSDLDTKIELNNKINAELEAMAKLIYDYWFVQFDFPNEQGKPYKSSGGKMVWAAELKREIPEGWEVKELGLEVKIGSGFPFISDEYLNSGKYKIITIKNVQDLQLDTTNVDYINELPLKMSSTCVLKIGDILMSLTGNVGRICLVHENNLLLNQRVGKIICRKELQNLMFGFFQSNDEKARLIKISTGSSQKNLSPVDAVKRPFCFPSDQLLYGYNKLIDPLIKKTIDNKIENQKLAELRDWLLPMLMNGQVRVSER